MIQTRPTIKLMALDPLHEKKWPDLAAPILAKMGLAVFKQERFLLVWLEVLSSGALYYSDACVLRRIWLARGRSALGICARRLYFATPQAGPIFQPEFKVLNGRARPTTPPAEDQIQFQLKVLDALKKGLAGDMALVTLHPESTDLKTARKVWIHDNACCSPPVRFNEFYRRHGFDRVPRNFTIAVCPMETVPVDTAAGFCDRLMEVAWRRKTKLRVISTTLEAVDRRLSELQDSGKKPRDGHCLLLILPDKKAELSGSSLRLMQSLTKTGVPFRRAYANDPLQFSVPDQFPSLVMAAGGRPHRVVMEAGGRPVWTVGVDLSHRVSQRYSVLALTLVAPNGVLAGAWKKVQRLDETARLDSLTDLLEACRLQLNQNKTRGPVVVLRDGRMFAHENARIYREKLQTEVSFLEYRKGGNPQMLTPDEPCQVCRTPMAASVPNFSTMFISTCPPRNDSTLTSVAKVTWHSEWNNLKLKPKDIAELLTVSAAAPGLGLHARHLPAPIYWADGIAGTNPQDLRFAGLPVEEIP